MQKNAKKLSDTAAAGAMWLAMLCCAAVPATAEPAPDTDGEWWKSAVLCEIYPRSFQDSDGDGVGDLNGINARLGYLEDLGIDAIWIAPMFPSPGVDFGYDISDYVGVDPRYGTLADMDRLIARRASTISASSSTWC